MNQWKALMVWPRGAQTAAQFGDGLRSVSGPVVAATAGKSAHQSRFLLKLALCQFFGLIFAEAAVVPAEKLHPQLNHIRSNRAVFRLSLITTDDHVIHPVAVTINATHARAKVDVAIRMPAGVAHCRVAGVAVITGTWRGSPGHFE